MSTVDSRWTSDLWRWDTCLSKDVHFVCWNCYGNAAVKELSDASQLNKPWRNRENTNMFEISIKQITYSWWWLIKHKWTKDEQSSRTAAHDWIRASLIHSSEVKQKEDILVLLTPLSVSFHVRTGAPLFDFYDCDGGCLKDSLFVKAIKTITARIYRALAFIPHLLWKRRE